DREVASIAGPDAPRGSAKRDARPRRLGLRRIASEGRLAWRWLKTPADRTEQRRKEILRMRRGGQRKCSSTSRCHDHALAKTHRRLGGMAIAAAGMWRAMARM